MTVTIALLHGSRINESINNKFKGAENGHVGSEESEEV